MRCMSLRQFHAVCLALLPALASFCSESLFAGQPSTKPNVLLLLADDLGYRDIGCYDGPVKTPTLDALASKGMRFSQFYLDVLSVPLHGQL